jgi:hypothetical protein
MLQTIHERIGRKKRTMWNFTVMAVMIIDATQFPIDEEAYVKHAQFDIATISHDALDIYGKFYTFTSGNTKFISWFTNQKTC